MEFEKLGVFLQTGDCQEVVDQKRQAPTAFVHRKERFFRHFPVFQRSVHQGFKVSVDDGERGAEFMGDIREKFPPGFLQISYFGHIVENHKCRRGAYLGAGHEPGNMHIEMLGPVSSGGGVDVERDLDLLRLSLGKSGLECKLELVLAKYFDDRPVERRVRQTQEFDKCVVDEADPLGAVGNKDPLDHARENGPEAEALVGNLTVKLLEQFGDFPDITQGFLKESGGCRERGCAEIPLREPSKGLSDLEKGSEYFEVAEETGDDAQNRRAGPQKRGQLPATALKR